MPQKLARLRDGSDQPPARPGETGHLRQNLTPAGGELHGRHGGGRIHTRVSQREPVCAGGGDRAMGGSEGEHHAAGADPLPGRHG